MLIVNSSKAHIQIYSTTGNRYKLLLRDKTIERKVIRLLMLTQGGVAERTKRLPIKRIESRKRAFAWKREGYSHQVFCIEFSNDSTAEIFTTVLSDIIIH